MIIKVTAAHMCSFVISGVKPEINKLTYEMKKKEAEAVAYILAENLPVDSFNHLILNLIELRDSHGPLSDSEVYVRCMKSAKESEV